MPVITDRRYFNGTETKIDRLDLGRLWARLEEILTGFPLRVEERRDANGAKAVRTLLDERFQSAGDWIKITTGGVDWTNCQTAGSARLCVGVEIQFSGRSDMLIVDVEHLRDEIIGGRLDIGAIVVPSSELAPYLTDRCPRFADALKAVERARAADLPLAVLALRHDGPGPALPKQQKRILK